MFEKHEARGGLPDDASLREVMTEWPRVIASVREEMDRGTDPSHAAVRSLAERWMELVRVFTGGDPGLEAWLLAVHQREPERAARHGVDPRLFGYLGRAMARLDEPE